MTVEVARLADGVEVSRIVNGAWQLSEGHQTHRSREEVFEALSRAVDAGLTAFDCADIYVGVEDLLGDFMREYRQREGSEAADRIRIHTKLVPDLDALSTLDKAYVERIVNRSLRRLGVERLDLVQFAWWSYEVDRWVEAAGWLDQLRQDGKLTQIGATNFGLRPLKAMVDAGIPIRTHQVQYSALDHRASGVMAEYCLEQGIGLFCYGTLAGGFLSNRYLGVPDPACAPGNRSLVKYRLIIDEYGGWDPYQSLLSGLHRIARRHDATIAQVALRYVLDRPGVTAAIVGVSRAGRVPEIVKAFDLKLLDHERETIRALARAAPGPEGPVYGLERIKGGRHAAIMKYGLNRQA